MVRWGNKEEDCTTETQAQVDAQLEACVKQGSKGKLNHAGHRKKKDERRLVANPVPRRLRTTPVQQLTTPLQQEERKLQQCSSCVDCASMICRLIEDANPGDGYCVDSCGDGVDCTCNVSRHLDADDNQDQERNLQSVVGSRPWTEQRITKRCTYLLKAFAENLMQDRGNDCLGDPDRLELKAFCVE